jgi:transmembrane sensor
MSNAKELIEKYLKGECSEEEKQFLEYWFHLYNLDKDTELSSADYKLARAKFERNIVGKSNTNKKVWYIAAASVLIAVSTLLGYNIYNKEQHASNQIASKTSTNQLLLLVDNNKEILLESLNETQPEVKKHIGVNGDVVYAFENEEKGFLEKTKTNTLFTPQMKTLKTRLPDGTIVWLNASSEISFKANFNDNEDRTVSLKGEAYFEVAKNADKPFIVITNNQTVNVLGTHFNVKVIGRATETSLLEGSVSLAKATKNSKTEKKLILKPGQQALFNGMNFNIGTFDIDKVLDWKEGDFIFKSDRWSEIIAKLKNWYNIDIVISNGDLEDNTFSGRLDRSNSIKETLSILEKSCNVVFDKHGGVYHLTKKQEYLAEKNQL